MSSESTPRPMDVDTEEPTTTSTTTTTVKSVLPHNNLAKDELQLPWVEKYRPKRLEDLVAHDDIIQIITKLIDSENLPHLLLYGPPGTGKTSTIVAAAKRMYGPKGYSTMALELNASDSRGISVVRNEIKEFAGTRQLFSKGVKLIILDEADAMTNDAQNALRRIVEKYTKNARFCLICNYVSKIIPALQSRCTRFRFAPLSKQQIYGRLVEVAKAEQVEYTENGLEAIVNLAGGDMRRVLNGLQSTAMSFPVVDDTSVYLTSGAPLPSDLDSIAHSLFNDEMSLAHKTISNLCTLKGYAMADILADLTTVVTSMDLPPGVLAELLDGMSGVEYRLAFGTDERLQSASLVGIFIRARLMMKVAS
mmetsp:Transcript_12295/g.14474  ORF Transcript_12295/g.14474 Transcript_12295/m.14474 type:complete len:364 (+) Transcript_12295:31-1122(+)|eukprot:CAMPEP_0198251424 /NCGR_PEP_ID=MMETSP1447-20131203/2262_1 /TAXON_ID=420782 /ORGANISM="Chaetoceros dichaeta, Strain CCMP1751" /LENGTH=363 /DNA_ID=CAMNT_0043936443 /DNA_START=17 /DNA_END=1108 /DNA_ORIENTATION=+